MYAIYRINVSNKILEIANFEVTEPKTEQSNAILFFWIRSERTNRNTCKFIFLNIVILFRLCGIKHKCGRYKGGEQTIYVSHFIAKRFLST